ncbi:organic solute transporter Ostalpha-domain-containing protein, partial [Amylostereum chailletii]
MVNGRCYNPRAPLEGPPLFQNGDIKFQAHDVGWIVCAFFTIVACVTSFWLVNKHLQWYTNKKEQRYIVRLLFMVPIYALISFASFLFWNNSTPLLLLRDAYEAVLLTSFFYLLLTYLSPDPEEQKAILRKEGLSRQNDVERLRRGEQPKKWFFPLGFVKWKPADGLYFLQYMKWAVLQYCVVRPVTTLAAIVLNYIGLYCEESWSPGWGHIWITGIISISVSVAMYCLVQFYLSVAPYLVKQKPVLKMVSIKAVVFLTFWQASALSLLTMFDIVKDTPYMTAADINIGWGALLETLEMAIFAFVHVKAFSYKPYRPAARDAQRTPRLRALMHAMDFRETFRELRAGTVYMWHQMRGKETDVAARREAHLVGAFDKSRTDVWRGMHRREKGADDGEEMGVDVTVRVDRVVDVDGERQWLGVGDDYGYGVARRERSDALGVQIERELARRGVMERGKHILNNVHDEHNPEPVDTRIQRSWWRGLYDRVSQSNPDDD